VVYLDSSAFVKRYVPEAGRVWLQERLRSESRLYSSGITYAEVHAVFARKYRQEGWTRTEFQKARNEFELDWLTVEEVAVTNETLRAVPVLVGQVPLRGMDAIHLAAIRWLQLKLKEAPELIASDARLLAAARQFGFAGCETEKK